jgi:hypothetical protein
MPISNYTIQTSLIIISIDSTNIQRSHFNLEILLLLPSGTEFEAFLDLYFAKKTAGFVRFFLLRLWLICNGENLTNSAAL